MKIIYGDGNGNLYIITDTKGKVIEYVPVKPAVSSSGVYDGGKRIKKKLSDAAFFLVQDAIMAALNASSIQTKDRVMGSGSILVEQDGSQHSCILKPGAAQRGAIETLLKQVLE